MFRSTWRESTAKHKQLVHNNEKPFACDHTGCSFRTKRRETLSSHKNAVHSNMRGKRCHVCGERFRTIYQLKDHMMEHEERGHKVNKCSFCSEMLSSLLSRKTEPTAGELVPCGHPGCDFRSTRKSSLSSHRKQVHSEERPFSCSHTGCSYRSKTRSNLTFHKKRVHLKIRDKTVFMCVTSRFFSKTELRAHMRSMHQTKNHDMDKCDGCITYLKQNQRLFQAQTASLNRRDRKRSRSE